MIDWRTKNLPLPDQRMSPVESIGLVITTAGTPAYVHLHLEQLRRMYGDGFAVTLPTLVVNDGDSGADVDAMAGLCDRYGVTFLAMPKLGHAPGDLRSIQTGLAWAEGMGIDLLAKMSRRFVPLRHWRNELMYLSGKNQHCAAFGRKNGDRIDGIFRTDCMVFRVRKWANDRARENIQASLDTKLQTINVESLIYSLIRVLGDWEMWPLVGQDFYRASSEAMQWRGLMPFHYGDLSRELGLPYTDADFDNVPVQAFDPRPLEPSLVCRVVDGPPTAPPPDVAGYINPELIPAA